MSRRVYQAAAFLTAIVFIVTAAECAPRRSG